MNYDDSIDSDVDVNNKSGTEESLRFVPRKKIKRSLHCDSLIFLEVTVNPRYLETI